MDNSLKGLILAAGVIITCIVVGLGFFISREAKNATDSGTSQLSAMSSQYDNVEFMMYDNLRVTGREVVNVIKKHSADINVVVNTKANNSGITYNASNKRLAEKTSNDYINPSALFLGELIIGANEELKEIVFTQQ